MKCRFCNRIVPQDETLIDHLAICPSLASFAKTRRKRGQRKNHAKPVRGKNRYGG